MIDPLLLGMRDTVLRTLESDVTVFARVRTRTPTGGSTYTWSSIATTKGRLMSMNNEDMEIAQRLQINSTHVCILPYDTPISNEDRIEVGGEAYDVFGVFTNAQTILKRCQVARVTQ